MRGRLVFALVCTLVATIALVWPLGGMALADENLPSKSDASCLKCHKYDQEPNLLAGRVVDVAMKAKAIQLQIGKDMEVIYFDDSTALKNAEEFKTIPKQEAVKIVYFKKDGKNFAKVVEVKKGLDIPKDQLASEADVAALVAQGPEKGKYVLYDSRPADMYNQGHVPTAVSMPFFAFDSLAEKLLPKDKEVLQVYYCAGLSCVLSPLAAKKAEKLGYKNVKVFHAGLPAWKKAGHIAVSNIAGLQEFIKSDASYILIDLRPKNLVEQGHIPHAVALPDGGLASMQDQLPKFKSAAIILYNQDGETASAEAAYKQLSDWGYKQVSLLAGGFHAWEKSGGQVAKGAAASKITYVRKLQPGEVELAVFRKQLDKPAGDTIILDVRGASEAAEGALPQSLNIPLDQLEQRLSDVPKDKALLLHCGTGARAEMAYNVLKKAGFDPKFLKAKVEFDKQDKGKFTIEE
jgi:rhodanese-related sulfurtransferase